MHTRLPKWSPVHEISAGVRAVPGKIIMAVLSHSSKPHQATIAAQQHLSLAWNVQCSASSPAVSTHLCPAAGPPYKYVRSDEAEAADAAGADALATKLGDHTGAPMATLQVPTSPFAQVQHQQEPTQQQQPQQPRVSRTLTVDRSKQSGSRDAGTLGESLLVDDGDVTGTEAETAREAAMLERRRSSASSRRPSFSSFFADAAPAEPKAEKELPPLCASAHHCIPSLNEHRLTRECSHSG